VDPAPGNHKVSTLIAALVVPSPDFGGKRAIVVSEDLVCILADRAKLRAHPLVGSIDTLHSHDSKRVHLRQCCRDDVRVAVRVLSGKVSATAQKRWLDLSEGDLERKARCSNVTLDTRNPGSGLCVPCLLVVFIGEQND
jgi:hypothetical protein